MPQLKQVPKEKQLAPPPTINKSIDRSIDWSEFNSRDAWFTSNKGPLPVVGGALKARLEPVFKSTTQKEPQSRLEFDTPPIIISLSPLITVEWPYLSTGSVRIWGDASILVSISVQDFDVKSNRNIRFETSVSRSVSPPETTIAFLPDTKQQLWEWSWRGKSVIRVSSAFSSFTRIR